LPKNCIFMRFFVPKKGYKTLVLFCPSGDLAESLQTLVTCQY
jgi:hypothetical protein